MKVLVTGASGTIGRPLATAFAKAGHGVRAAARNPQALGFAAGIESVHLGDLAAPIDWMPLLADIDAVVHLAGIAHTGTQFTAAQYDRVNHQATDNLARAAARAVWTPAATGSTPGRPG